MAMTWSSNCWDWERVKQVYALARRVFQGKNEPLKFESCFLLMHDFEDREAINYLLDQTQSRDRDRVFRAIAWLGDIRNRSTPIYSKLLRRLKPFLNTNNKRLRISAIDALSTYSGDDVIQSLIPLLGDSDTAIVENVKKNLLDRDDTAGLRRHLKHAAQSFLDPGVRKMAQELVAHLNRTGNP